MRCCIFDSIAASNNFLYRLIKSNSRFLIWAIKRQKIMKSTGHGFLEPNMTKTHSLLWCERKQIFTLWHLINNFSVISKGNKMHDLLTKDTSTQGVGLCGFKISRLQTFFHLRKDRFHVLYSIKELLKKTTTSAYSVGEVLSGGDLPPLYVQSWFLTLSHQFITCTVRQMSWHLGQLAHHQAVWLDSCSQRQKLKQVGVLL